ncbi:RNA polymerase sigma factor [Galbitalea soli]|uniref:RNA polymerase sigma factor n=2 Tax=Galbitalea soli TaxID=1268042 RepID=A0A7C9TSC5_9MICO|nr:RNA polymerase sigma factor [Galbitalea soli]NEM91824.1 RNA polymerase sigma factor [Galbitalea soli]
MAGTQHAFAVLFYRHRGRVFNSAYRRLSDASRAEEAVAIVFLECWRARRRARIVDGSLLPWLLAITTHVTANLSRSHRRYSRLLTLLPPAEATTDIALDIDEQLDGRKYREAIGRAIACLPRGDREVVELCLIEELAMTEAARVLDVPVGTVKSRLHRARKQLRTQLATAGIGGASPGCSHPSDAQ